MNNPDVTDSSEAIAVPTPAPCYAPLADTLMPRNYGLRKCREVRPGWPQAVWVLTCGHRIIVPTWSDGRCRPKPPNRVHCEDCWEAEWDKRYAVWKAHNVELSDRRENNQR